VARVQRLAGLALEVVEGEVVQGLELGQGRPVLCLLPPERGITRRNAA